MKYPVKNPNKFRSDTGKRWTAALFYELNRNMPEADRRIEPMYSLNEKIPGLICFKEEYVKDMDISGYKTAVRLLENYDHWMLLMRSSWFVESKKQWDKEVAAKMEQEATDVLRGIMKNDEAKLTERISAAKVMLGKAKTIGKEETRGRGRPSKEEVQGELKEQARLTKEEQDDAARISFIRK